MHSVAAERRLAPRQNVRDTAELASGQVLITVRVDDISETGCGVVIMSQVFDVQKQLGTTGLLSFRPVRAGDPAVVLPVVLCEARPVGSTLRYGLQFRELTPRQSSRLATVIRDLAPEQADAAASPAWTSSFEAANTGPLVLQQA